MVEEKNKDFDSFSIEKNKKIKSWWKKVKEAFKKSLFLTKIENDNFSYENIVSSRLENTSYQAWTKAIDTLSNLVQNSQEKLDPSPQPFDIEQLGMTTTLFHLDRLIVKTREYMAQYRYRLDQYSQRPEVLDKTEFIEVNKQCNQCYNRLINITKLLQNISPKKLYSDVLINEIHALDLETVNLGSAMRSLNQFACQQEAMLQLTQLEQSLIQSLVQSQTSSSTTLFHYVTGNSQELLYSTGEYLRSKLTEIYNVEHIEFINILITIHDMLRKCYVIARRSVVKDTLDLLGENIDELISVFSQESFEKERAFSCLFEIYYCIESLRFSSNRESRCSQNLFEKSKLARHQLRKACLNHALGQEFIKKIAISKASILKKPSGFK